MTKVMLSETELAALKRLGDILIPGARAMPVFSAVEGIDRLLQVAADATRTAPGRLSAALVGLPALNGLADAKAHAEAAGLYRDHNGQRYWFCCAACGPMWDADPDEYAAA